ncbi:MAG TPA: hypothetical protein VFR47_06670 [Anaerolineales bacterium]|nr:hypothetical protein [Anaerolineales bacterium]
MTEHSTRSVSKILLGDEKQYGWLRFAFLLVIPILLPILILIFKVTVLRPFLGDYFQLFVIYLLGLLSAIAAAVAYIQDIYGLNSDRMPFRHFLSAFFGLGLPKIHIANRMDVSDGQELVELIGGPAVLNIDPGYAVLTETLTSPANLYGQGGHFISRRERVYEIIDLHEQEGVAKLKSTTRDGITVIVENLKYNYRLWDSVWEFEPAGELALLNPFPFSAEAVHNFVYSRTVSVDDYGTPMKFDWRGAVGGRVKGIVKDYISERRLDDVIAPHEHLHQNPRQEIRDKAYLPDFQKSLRGMGTVLRWWDPGEFKSLEPIEEQFLSNWSVDITSNIQINEAYGHAQKQAYEELGRAEAEAELLMSIIHSLDGIRFGDDKTQTLQNLILIRTAQVIRALNISTTEGSPQRPDQSTLHPTAKNS